MAVYLSTTLGIVDSLNSILQRKLGKCSGSELLILENNTTNVKPVNYYNQDQYDLL